MRSTGSKIRIAILFAFHVLTSYAADVSITLEMPLKPQEKSKWCWAAVTQAIAAKHGGHYSQTEIAGTILRGDPKACRGPKADCNYRHRVERALILYDVWATYHEGATTVERATRELKAGNPLVMNVNTLGGGAHALLIFGVEEGKLEIWDPD